MENHDIEYSLDELILIHKERVGWSFFLNHSQVNFTLKFLYLNIHNEIVLKLKIESIQEFEIESTELKVGCEIEEFLRTVNSNHLKTEH